MASQKGLRKEHATEKSCSKRLRKWKWIMIKKKLLSKQLQWRGKISAGKWFHKRGCGKKMLQKKPAANGCRSENYQEKIVEQTAAVNGQNIYRKMASQKGLRKENATEKSCGKWLRKWKWIMIKKIAEQSAAVKAQNICRKMVSQKGLQKENATEKTCGKWLRKWKLSRKNCWGNSCSEWAKYLQENGFTEKGCGKKMLQKKPAANGCGSENYQEKIVEQTAAVNGQNICRKMASQKGLRKENAIAKPAANGLPKWKWKNAGGKKIAELQDFFLKKDCRTNMLQKKLQKTGCGIESGSLQENGFTKGAAKRKCYSKNLRPTGCRSERAKTLQKKMLYFQKKVF